MASKEVTQELVAKWHEEAVAEWLADHATKGEVRAKVFSFLDRKLDETIAKMIGFSNSWSRWEVDHCNGRAGESAAGDFLRQHCHESVQEWLKSAMTKAAMPTPAIKKAVVSEYRELIHREARSYAREVAEEHARTMVDGILVSAQTEATP